MFALSSQSDAAPLTPVSSKASTGTTTTANDSALDSDRATAGSVVAEEPSGQPIRPPVPFPNIPDRPIIIESSLHERLQALPQHPDPYSRIGHYTVSAQQAIDQFDLVFDPDNSI